MFKLSNLLFIDPICNCNNSISFFLSSSLSLSIMVKKSSNLYEISAKYCFLLAPPFFMDGSSNFLSFLAIIFSPSFNLAAKFSYSSNRSIINCSIEFSVIFEGFFCSVIIFFSGSNNSLCCLINSSYSFIKLLYNNNKSSGKLSCILSESIGFFNFFSNGIIYKLYKRKYNDNILSVFLSDNFDI